MRRAGSVVPVRLTPPRTSTATTATATAATVGSLLRTLTVFHIVTITTTAFPSWQQPQPRRQIPHWQVGNSHGTTIPTLRTISTTTRMPATRRSMTNGDIRQHFQSKDRNESKETTTTKDKQEEASMPSSLSQSNPLAESLADRLQTTPYYLTNDGESWYLYIPQWMPSNKADFQEEWKIHPTERHPLKMFGREFRENRWSQAWGVSYRYSGSINRAKSLNEAGPVVRTLVGKANELVNGLIDKSDSNNDSHNNGEAGDDVQDTVRSPYQGCLQNWYTPDDTIGLHADDESSMRQEFPIFSLSWGGPRRFLFRRRENKKDKIELFLQDGDLLVMGGTIQQTHMHEVPKRRKTMDPVASDRINWTIRAYRNDLDIDGKRQSKGSSSSSSSKKRKQET